MPSVTAGSLHGGSQNCFEVPRNAKATSDIMNNRLIPTPGNEWSVLQV